MSILIKNLNLPQAGHVTIIFPSGNVQERIVEGNGIFDDDKAIEFEYAGTGRWRGRWVWDSWNTEGGLICSTCDYRCPVDVSKPPYNYCPHCGSEMEAYP